MKKVANLFIILGIICFIGIIVISAISRSNLISKELKTMGLIGIGYIGVILFTYGWLKRFKAK